MEDLKIYHPGSYIKELLEETNITEEEFAHETGIKLTDVTRLLKGEITITVDMAEKIGKFSQTSSGLWLSLQNRYNERAFRVFDSKQASEAVRKTLNLISEQLD